MSHLLDKAHIDLHAKPMLEVGKYHLFFASETKILGWAVTEMNALECERLASELKADGFCQNIKTVLVKFDTSINPWSKPV